ncbi:MAG TPA: BREX system ATP-binding domain-containing protein, partial [Puia sp.]|nr:BREX system ATP-binding domain-containing protein [Puia sp.]
NEIFVLLRKLKEIFDFRHQTQINVSDTDIHAFMEEMFNKPGASVFLTPREVNRGFLNILNMLLQHPHLNKKKLFGELEIKDERPDTVSLDTIEEL